MEASTSSTVAESSLPLRSTMASPSEGSANPAVSLESLWAYVQPALDHIVHGPATGGRPPSLDPSYHMGIHTAVYNYFTSQRSEPRPDPADPAIPTDDLYTLLDKYFQSTVQAYLRAIPTDPSALLSYYVDCFGRYSAAVLSIHRLLNYVNRHYVKRAQDEDRGWLRFADLFEPTAKNLQSLLQRDRLSHKLRDRRLSELANWGYKEGLPEGEISEIEMAAEAASSPDRVVHVRALGYRRWRIELLEPLLTVPKVGNKGGRGGKKTAKRPPALMSRLARSVHELLESQNVPDSDKRPLAERVLSSLRVSGVRTDHPLRRRIERFILHPDAAQAD